MSKSNELDKHVSEADLQLQVEELLTLKGWLWFHDRATNLAHVNNPGFPDLVAVHPRTGNVLFIELKSQKGRITNMQREWASALSRPNRERSHFYMLVKPATFDILVGVIHDLSGGDPQIRHRLGQSDAERGELGLE